MRGVVFMEIISGHQWVCNGFGEATILNIKGQSACRNLEQGFVHNLDNAGLLPMPFKQLQQWGYKSVEIYYQLVRPKPST